MGDTFDLKTKIQRAFYALIVGTGVGKLDNTYPGEATDTTENRTLPNTTIDAGDGFEEDFTGNYRFPGGRIIFRDLALTEGGADNEQASFQAARKRVSAIIEQLVLSDDETTMDYTRRQLNAWGRAMAVDDSNGTDPVKKQAAENNSDMADFTLIYYRLTDYGSPKKATQEGGVTYFEREMLFECLACNSNRD